MLPGPSETSDDSVGRAIAPHQTEFRRREDRIFVLPLARRLVSELLDKLFVWTTREHPRPATLELDLSRDFQLHPLRRRTIGAKIGTNPLEGFVSQRVQHTMAKISG